MGRYSRSASRSRSRDRDGGGGGGGGEEDGYRVHVADLGVDCSQREIEKTFSKFGELKEVWLARNPPCFAFVVFKRRGDAEDSIRDIDGRVVCGSRVRCSWARPRTRGRPPVGRNDDSFRCYQCGEKGHFSRDCRNTRGGGGAGYRSSGGGGRRYDDDYRRSKPSRRSRSRSRGGSRTRHRRSSYSRSRSRSISRGRKSGDIDNGIRNGAY